jgi:hypothetical protein
MKPYLLYYAILGLSTLEIDGNLVIKIYETGTQFTLDSIWIIAQSFKSWGVIRPLSIAKSSGARYLIL